MNRWHGCMWMMAMAMVAASSPARAGDVYKCATKGGVAYQDHPCPGALPGTGKVAGLETNEPAMGGDPAPLLEKITRIDRQISAMAGQRDREREGLRLRMAGEHDLAVQRRAADRLQQNWQQRFEQARQQKQAMLDQLHLMCPHGASDANGEYLCDTRRTAGPETAEGRHKLR